MEGRAVNFPSGASYGDVHVEHNRAWEYVAPGIWRSTSVGVDVGWDDVDNKPNLFPPSAHKHQIDDVTGLQAALDSEESARIAGDNSLQGKINKEESARIAGDNAIQGKLDNEITARKEADTLLDLRIDAVEDSITDDGGFVDAPNDGKLYGRQSENWELVPDAGASDWADINNKPAKFPPEAHDQPWSSITNTPSDYPPSAHNHQIGDVNGLQDALDEAGGGVGGVFISDTEPSDPEDGMMWLDSTTAIVWLWDEDKWLEFPAGGSGDDYDDTQVQAGITANTAAIADNATDIATNTAAIADNATEIAKKLDASAYAPYDDTQVKADIAANTSDIAGNASGIAANASDIASKLDADKIWTGTEAQYNSTSKDADTLYFITA